MQQYALGDAEANANAMNVPPDLAAALAAHSEAAERFAQAAPSYRNNVLRWIKAAKAAPTRDRRIVITVDHAARGTKVPQM